DSGQILPLWLLYFVQGMPYGLQSSLLPIYFRSVGLSFTRIGLAKVLYLPWILKVLWAPLVDQYLTKRSWLLLSMSGLLAACLAGASLTPEIHFLPVAAMLLLMNLLASVQDIAVDGVAVQLLGQEEVGHGNTIQVVAYKMGSVVAGGGFLTLMNRLGWGCLFVFLAAIYLLAILYAWGAPELRGTRPSTSQESCARTRTLNLWWILRELLSVPDTPWTIGFVLLYKLGEQGATTMFPLFLLDHGFSSQQLGLWTGLVAVAFSIVGSSLGGHLLSKQRAEAPPISPGVCLPPAGHSLQFPGSAGGAGQAGVQHPCRGARGLAGLWCQLLHLPPPLPRLCAVCALGTAGQEVTGRHHLTPPPALAGAEN
uniref:Major facilitator superfamily domain containing 3 n=1 Tax=Sphenodon punctatus TaxID=8508 RepID=A0A8D0HTA9_SPHPU